MLRRLGAALLLGVPAVYVLLLVALRQRGARHSELRAGERVDARFSDGRWYPATIMVAEGGFVLVAWEDGDPRDTRKTRDEVRRRSPAGNKDVAWIARQHMRRAFAAHHSGNRSQLEGVDFGLTLGRLDMPHVRI